MVKLSVKLIALLTLLVGLNACGLRGDLIAPNAFDAPTETEEQTDS